MNTTCLATALTISRRSLREFLPALPPRVQRWAAVLAVGLALPLQVSGQALTDSTNFPVSLVVPDGDPDGLASTVTVSTPIQVLTNLQVTLDITNGWNGDLYAYLVHSSGFVVLLNRPGKSEALPFGYDDPGFDVTFDDAATTNVHTYRLTLFGNENTPLGGPLTSIWAPDGRNVDPATVSSTNTPNTFLSSFNGLNPNGQWTLFVADLASGDISTLVSWGLQMSGTPGGPAITITTQPTNTTAECGGDATFSVTAAGTEPLHYQWQFGAAPVGIDSSNLVLNSVSAANAGSYTVVITNSSGSITSQVATLAVQDTTPPVITLLGDNPLTNECHSAFVDPGAAATDNCTTPTLTTNSTVNPDAVGSYAITYVATDGSGNSATNTRAVYVADTTPPVPDIASLPDVTGQCSATITAPTAYDACDGPITATTGDPLTYTSQGTFTVHWAYTDSHGNSTNQTQTVRVQDTLAPVITFSFTNLTLSADANCQAVMPDVTGTNYILAADACSSVLTITQTPTNNAVLPLGTNEVVLAVADGNGNTAYSTNTVVVVDQTAPVITVLGASPLTNECHMSFVDPGATALDNCSGVVSLSTNSTVNPMAVGIYTITYVATDAARNSATNTRQVYVVDTTAPNITQCAPPQTATAGYNGLATLSDLTTLVVASDACSASVHITQQPPSGTAIPVGPNTVMFYVDDGNGNTNTCSSTVTVNAVVLVPPTILSEQVLDDGSFQLTFSGPNGQPYKVIASPDVAVPLADWAELTIGNFGADPVTFTDPDSTSYPARFYRGVSP